MIDLEDNFEDIVSKTMRGTGLSDAVLSFLTQIDENRIARLKEGEFDEEALRAIAPSLGLCADSLVERARGEWRPEVISVQGLAQFNTIFDDDPEDPMTVNSYLAWDPKTQEAALFDTGADASPALQAISNYGLELRYLFLTHTHADHIGDRQKVLEAHPEVQMLANGRESIRGARRFQAGETFSVGTLRVTTRLTWGHSPAGTSYVIRGLDRPVAVVGDALFAQSMGGPMISFQASLESNRKELFSLEDETVVCPGHGPMTSIGEEKAHNPFFPEFKREERMEDRTN